MLPAALAHDDLFEAFFDLSLTGGVLYEPVRDAAGAVVDLAFVRLNPAAQQLLALPPRPDTTFLRQFPGSVEDGSWSFYRDALLADEPRELQQRYQADGLDAYYVVRARRVGAQLLVSFLDAADQPRLAASQALHDSQAREQAARAEAEAQRQRLHQVLMRMPANIALLRGPAHVYDLVNPAYERLFPARTTLGRPMREVIPEIAGQGFYELFDRVYQTGEPFYAAEVEAQADFAGTGELERRYYRTAFEPIRNAQDEVVEILSFAVDITEQVLARQQVEQLNQELEARVQQRTQEADAARAEAERQQGELKRIFAQAPVGIVVYRGERFIIEQANDFQLAIWDCTLEEALGKGLFELLPEVAGQGFEEALAGVLATGMPFLGTDMPASFTRHGVREPIYVSFGCTPLREADGHISGVVVVVSDTTEQVLARRQADTMQAALLAATRRQVQQREELYQVFEQAPVAVVLLREPDHRVEYVNPAFQQLFAGVPLRGRLIGEALPEAAGPAAIADLDRVFATGEPYLGEEQALPLPEAPGRPAQTRYFNFTYQPYREDGRIVGVSVFAYDVTEAVLARRAAHEALVRQQQELHRVFEQAPVAIFVLHGPALEMRVANPAMQELLGKPAGELLNRPYAEALPELAAQGYSELLTQVWRTGQPVTRQESPAHLTRHQPGEMGYFTFVYQPIFDAAGQTTDIMCVALDVTTQVLARHTVEASARQLRLLTDALPVLIAYLDLEERYRFTNEAYRLWFDRDPQAVLGLSVRELVGDAAYANMQPYLARARAGEQFTYELRMPYSEDNVRYIRVSYVPDRQAGELRGFYSLITDVTEQALARQQAAQANQELEARVQERTREVQAARAGAERERALLQALLAQAPVAIALFQGEEVRIASANEQMAALWGRTPGQVLELPLLAAVPELRGQGFDDIIRGVMATGVTYVGTEAPASILVAGQLVDRYYNFSCQAIYDAQGELLGVVNVAVDVTGQVETRRAVEQLNQELENRVQERTRQLHEQQRLLHQILGNVPAYIVTLSGPEYRYTFFNELYQRFSAGRAELGLPVAQAFPELVDQGFVALLDQVYATGQPYTGTDMPAQLFNPATGHFEQIYVDFIYQPFFDEQQQVQGIMAFILDVSDKMAARLQVQLLNEELAAINEELRATNEELQTSNAQLTYTNTDLDTFVYTASHDLKAPITNIEGLVLALRQELPAIAGPVVPHLLELMDKSVARFLQTISQLTDVSRLQRADQEEATPVALAPLLDDIRLDLAPLFAGTGAQLLADFSACPTVVFAPKNLRSILYNLVSNALKYRDPARRPEVRVRATRTAEAVVLEVQDNGLGLSEAQQDKLFQLFKRLHAHVEGTGVGLYMLRRIVENARGSITVQSEPGRGSTFTVLLPRLSASPS